MVKYGSYEHRHKVKDDELEGEELDVQAALRDYRFDEDQHEIFCPIAPLFDRYKTFINRRNYQPPGRAVLTRQQFGVALRRVFSLTSEDRCQRWVHGKKMYGYLGLIGEHSVRLPDARGRRSKQHDYYVDPENPEAAT